LDAAERAAALANFVQRGSIGAHFDFISGNGGSTLNYGTVFDPAPFVGRGGSITNIQLRGDIGNIDPNVAIRATTTSAAGETVADFVTDRLVAVWPH
jgi:hypothetical protein